MQIGDKVLAQWPAEMVWWYPATVCGVEGGSIEVQYDDGARTKLQPDQAIPLSIQVGQRVNSRFGGGEFYFGGVVTEMRGNAIHINYDDGDKEWSTVGMVRINQNDIKNPQLAEPGNSSW